MHMRRQVEMVTVPLLATMLCCTTARADTIWVMGGNGREVPLSNVRVGQAAEGKLLYQAANGQEAARELAQITRLELDDEPALGAADAAYAQQKWESAVEGYSKAMDATRREWVK